VLTGQIYRLLLVSLRSCQKTEEANQLWIDMVANGVGPDHTAYNVKVWYHAVRDEIERVGELISEMEASGDKRARPDTITYNYLIGCLSKNDRVKDVKDVYKMMMSKKKRCSPNATTFKHVFCCLLRSGDFEAGIEVFRDSLRSNNLPYFWVLKNLVEGLVKEGKVEAAKEVIKEARNKCSVSLSSRWKNVENKLGLGSDCEVTDLSQEV
jgi:pentatricopeptide repeat protein